MPTMRNAAAAAIVAAVVALTLGSGGCGSSDDSSSDDGASGSASPAVSSTGETVKVKPVAQAQTKTIHVGDTVEAALPGNPSTGYMWEAMLDEKGTIETAGEATFEPSSDAEGSPGTVMIPLKATGPGYATVLFKEVPPGDPNGTPANIGAASFEVRDAEQGTEPKILQTDQPAQETVVLNVGDVMEVELPGNASTGYSWVEDTAYMDDAVLVQDGEPSYDADSDEPGSPGTYTLRWKAVGPGDVVVLVKSVPPGEDDGVPDDIWAAWVSVE